MSPIAPATLETPRRQWRDVVQRFAPLTALLLLVIITSILNPAFLKPENLLNLLRQNSFIGIVALGMTLVIVSGGIDLSVGSLVALVGVTGLWMMNTAINAPSIISSADLARQIHISPMDSGLRIGLAHLLINLHLASSEACGVLLAVLTMLVVSILAGWLNGLLIARGRLAPFIATLATMAIFRSLAESIADGGEVRSASEQLFTRIGDGGISLPGMQIAPGVPLLLRWPVIVFAILAIIAAILLKRTRYGRYVHAIGCNERSAVYSAVNVPRVKTITYIFSGLSCGIAGLLLCGQMNSVNSSGSGTLFELDAIAAVVIGGTRMRGGAGSIGGTVIGVLLLGVIGNMLLLLDISPYLQGTVKGFIIIAAVLVQRGGSSGET